MPSQVNKYLHLICAKEKHKVVAKGEQHELYTAVLIF